jgi:hypothetical protein
MVKSAILLDYYGDISYIAIVVVEAQLPLAVIILNK